MANSIAIAVVGAGLVGTRHVAALSQSPGAHLCAIVEPGSHGRDIAKAQDVPWFPTVADLLEAPPPGGVILATPTPLHVDQGTELVRAGLPVLIEKPLAAAADAALALVQEAERRGVPLLVGHHRRHNPLIQHARALLSQGAIGDIRTVQATCWFYKPEDYFDRAPWRKQRGAGPISVNLIHDVDLLRHLCGEVISVQARSAASRRGFENEDVAAALLTFEGGAIGTISVSDSVVSPWSWELTAREYPIYPPSGESCYLIGGSDGALSVPDLRLWRHEGGRSWWNPITATVAPRPASDPLINQIDHFAEVIRGTCPPLVSGREGLQSLRVVEAIQSSARTQTLERLVPDHRGDNPARD